MTGESSELNVRVTRVLMRALRSVPELRAGLGVTMLLAFIGAAGRVSIPVLLGRAIDQGLQENAVDMGVLVRLAIIGFVIAQLTTVASALARYRLGVRSEQALASLRRQVTNRILDLSLAQHGSQRRGVLVARITSDVESMSHFFGWGALMWLMNIGVFGVVGVVMLMIDWQLALITIACTIPIAWFTFWINRPVMAAHVAVREQIGTYLGGVSELVGAAPLVRAYRAERSLGDRVVSALELRRKTSRRAQALGAGQFVAVDFVTVLTICVVVLAMLARRDDPSLSAGTAVGFVFLVRSFIEPLMDIGETLFETNNAAAGMNRLLDLIDLPVDVGEPMHPTSLPGGPIGVEFRAVEYEYPPRPDEPPSAEVFALRDINIVIAPGETVAFVGATGSGKSTLAKLAVRSADPTSGSVFVGGIPLPNVALSDLRQRVQLVPQEPFLFDASIAENLRLADSTLTDAQLHELLDQVGLGEWITSLPAGLQTGVGERGDLLSAGERQLVALARARAANPDVLVLDEATSSVDAATEAQLSVTLDALAKDRTTIVIAHRLTTVARADRVVVIDHGRIAEVGTPSELVAKPSGHYARLVQSWERATGAARL